jgi:glycosyltransferase involved in cell wall biosynthesis
MAGVKTIVSTLHGSHVLMSMAADGHVRPWLLRLSRLMHLTGFWLSNAIILDADGLCKDVKDMFGVIPFCNGARIFRKTTTIHNGIDLTQFTRTKDLRNLRENLGLSEDCMIVGTVCRLDEPKKGLAVLLKAAKQVIDQGFDVHFLVVGEGYSKSDLVSLSRKLGIEFRAHFVGYWENLLEVFRSLDVFVLPSLSEGFPLVNLEAMACGLPVITTQVGGAAEAVIDSVTGLTVPPGDPAKLANAISALLCQPERRRSMGESGLQLVRSRFDEKQMATKIQDLYQKLCN